MMIIDNNLLKIKQTIFVFATLVVLGGCTTTATQSVQHCSTRETNNLSKQIDPTKLKLNFNQKRLTIIRTEISKERCNGSIFSPQNKSAKCERLKKQEEKLVGENISLQERLNEINATIAGQPHAGKHVIACKPSWLPVQTIRRAPPKNAEVKLRTPKRQKTNAATVAKNIKAKPTFIEDYVVPAYSPTKTVKTETVGYAPSPQPLSQTPNHIAPAAVAPPTERAYSDSTQVRVIGSSFFPDQSKLIGPPAPAHAPAP